MKITLAALLHDIGKFYQRTGEYLQQNYRNNYSKNDGYIHACYTAKFIGEKLNINSFDAKMYEFTNLSAGHHRDYYSIVKKADFIASGHDRRPAETDEYFVEDTEKQAEQNGHYKNVRMNSIFNEIKLDENQLGKPSYVSLKPYDLFSIKTDISNISVEIGEKEYKEMFSQFIQEIEKMNEKCYSSYEALHHLIYPLLKKYTATIPANTMSPFPTVSLFDHLKLTAAVANVLEKEVQDIPFVLFDYDVSGIQSFIYQITEGDKSKEKISKSLRTRSFYLNIFADFIAYYITSQFNVSYENVLYSSSGRGRILLPNIKDFDLTIQKICSKIDYEMFKLYHGTLSVSFEYVKATESELKSSNLSELVSYKNKMQVNNKKQKFIQVISNPNFEFVKSAPEKLCPMCGIYETNHDLCEFCEKMIELNDKIIAKSETFVVEYSYNNNKVEGDFHQKVGELGQISIHLKVPKEIHNDSYYLSINDYFIGETKYYARSVKPNISFKDIEKIKKGEFGDNKIAVIKMDVDNLGYIFMRGLKNKDEKNKDKETLSKLLTLSRTLDYFFSKKLVEICKENVYINYAGGDDLVIICPGWQSLELVNNIQNEFQKFTNYNDSFHISSGIDLFDAVTPIRYAVERAEENLEQSKKVPNKDAFTVLNCSLKNDLLADVIENINCFEQAILSEQISRGGIYDIYSAVLNSLEDTKLATKKYMRYIPHIAYSIARNISDDTWRNKLKEIFVKELNIEELKKYKIILSYALMNTREEKEKNVQ